MKNAAGTFAYPAHWWGVIPIDSAPEWEIRPQAVSAESGKVILSKRNELGLLSNFAATPFDYQGKRFASVEGFWQALKYPESAQDQRAALTTWPHSRSEVTQLSGREAKKAGDFASAVMKEHCITYVTFESREISYYEIARGEFYQLIYRVMEAKLSQHPQVKEILSKTGELILLSDHQQEITVPPAWKYNEMWMEIRSKMNT